MDQNTIAALAQSYQDGWGVAFSPEDLDAWVRELTTVRLDLDEALSLYRRFCDERPHSRIPRLADITAHLRRHQNPATARWVPPEHRCAYCGDCGWFPLAAPVDDHTGNVKPEMLGFYPGTVWGRTLVYEFVVPCLCSVGQKKEGGEPEALDSNWTALRGKFKAWYDRSEGGPAAVMPHWTRLCAEAYRAAHSPAPRRPILADPDRRAKLQEQVKTLAEFAGVDLSEIPF